MFLFAFRFSFSYFIHVLFFGLAATASSSTPYDNLSRVQPHLPSRPRNSSITSSNPLMRRPTHPFYTRSRERRPVITTMGRAASRCLASFPRFPLDPQVRAVLGFLVVTLRIYSELYRGLTWRTRVVVVVMVVGGMEVREWEGS